MKYLTDTEIISWNDRLSFTNDFTPYMPSRGQVVNGVRVSDNYRLSPTYDDNGSNPNISLYRISNYEFSSSTYGLEKEPIIKYKYSFSILKNKSEYFNNILNKFLSEKIGTRVVVDDKNTLSIKIENDIANIDEVECSIFNKDYITYNYNFNGPLYSIIFYITNIEDTISFLSQIFGFDENDEECYLLNYKIGDMVCEKKDRSVEYIIDDYEFNKIGGKYYINYIVKEITMSGPIIKYGNSKVFESDKIVNSRDSILRDILK